MITAAPARLARPRHRFLYSVLVLLLLLAAIFFWRPLTFFDLADRGRLWLSGARAGSAQAGKYRIHYLAAGTGRPIVLLHGRGLDSLCWAPYIPALAAQGRVYALDLLGHGASERPDVDYSISLQTQVVRDFLDSQSIQQADLVGLSMGGWVALDFARQYPERVRRLVAIDAGGQKYDPAGPQLSLPRTRGERDALRSVLTPKESLPDFILRDMARRWAKNAVVLQRFAEFRKTGRDELPGKLASVSMPVLLLWGEQDALTPLAWGEELHAQVPQSELVILPGCGHAAMMDCRAQVLPELGSFLSAEYPPGGNVRYVSGR